jgi:acyl dehydratase
MDYYWEDLEIGLTEAFGPIEVDREQVIEFARQFDPQPFHLEDEAAAQTHFGRLAASGWHTCSMMMGAMVRARQQSPGWQVNALGAMGLEELRWRRPVFPGDVLRGTSELVEKLPSHSRPTTGILKWRTRLVNQEDLEVLSLVSVVLHRRRPAASAE